jgi:hypothetical protein
MLSGEGGTRSRSYSIHFWKVLPPMLITPQAATFECQIQARHVMEHVTKHVRQHDLDDGMSQSVKTVVAGRGRSLGPSRGIAYGGCVDAHASKFEFMHAIFEYCVLACFTIPDHLFETGWKKVFIAYPWVCVLTSPWILCCSYVGRRAVFNMKMLVVCECILGFEEGKGYAYHRDTKPYVNSCNNCTLCNLMLSPPLLFDPESSEASDSGGSVQEGALIGSSADGTGSYRAESAGMTSRKTLA